MLLCVEICEVSGVIRMAVSELKKKENSFAQISIFHCSHGDFLVNII